VQVSTEVACPTGVVPGSVQHEKRLKFIAQCQQMTGTWDLGKNRWMRSFYTNKRERQSGFSSRVRIVDVVGIMN